MAEISERLPLTYAVELLGDRDWRQVAAATQLLLEAGDEGWNPLLDGMNHPSPRVRRGCADFMDHYGDQRCVDALRRLARYDPVPNVRRSAVHSLGCQRCKSCPLEFDGVGFLAERALYDENDTVRCEAVSALRWQPQDARAASALHTLLREETNEKLLKAVRHTLQFHDPSYHQHVIGQAKARERERSAGAPP